MAFCLALPGLPPNPLVLKETILIGMLIMGNMKGFSTFY
jgi:hypothetical protein